jgi:hypothetical protein
MNKKVLKEIQLLLGEVKNNNLKWKPEKGIEHLKKRKRRMHIPNDWTMKEYNKKIIEICKGLSHDAYLYYKEFFCQNFYVFGDQEWIVLIGADSIIETAFPPDDYDKYLNEKDGYKYLGTIEEVLNHE